MNLKQKHKNKLYTNLFHLLFKQNRIHMDNKSAFAKALVDSSHAKIRNEKALKKLIEIWEERAEIYCESYKEKREREREEDKK